MRRGIEKRIISIGLAVLMIVSCAAGCGKKDTETKSAAFGEVWSAPSTVKILRDDVDYADKREAELTYNTVKNEYESQQLIITAKKDIKKYNLITTDLSGAAGIISKDNVEVYNEKYVPISEKQYFGGVETYAPDPLLPIDTAIEYGEATVKKGKNAALWVRVHIPKDTAAGEYTGTFTLEVDGSEMEIPVSVTVNDYTLPDDFSSKTLFSWRYDRVGAGEFDSSITMMTKYYDYFLDNGISLQSMPMEALTGEEMIAALEKYYDRITTFCILQEVGEISGDVVASKEIFKNQIFSIAAAATPEKNYFDKAMIYTADEPDFNDKAVVDGFVAELGTVAAVLKDCADEIAADNTGKYDNFKKVDNWREFVEDIPLIVPITVKGMTWIMENKDTADAKAVLDVMNCICPVYSCFTAEWTEEIYRLCDQYDMRLWWYGCVSPTAPASTYHIGDLNLLSARSITWLQLYRGIEGNLYWDAAAYTAEDTDLYNQYIDVYSHPYRIHGLPAGDGFLTYPGAPYGIDGPVTSMRLMSYRDGVEEYEMLKALINYYDSLSDVYGEKFVTEDCMNYFYNLLTDGEYSMMQDGQNGLVFDELRAQLIQNVVWINEGIDYALSTNEYKENMITVNCFAKEGSEVAFNDEQVPSDGNGCYMKEVDLTKTTEVVLSLKSAEGKTYEMTYQLGEPTLTLEGFADEKGASTVSVTDGSKATLVSGDKFASDGKGMLLEVNGVLTGNELDDAVFTPTVSIDTNDFAYIDSFDELSAIQFDIYNEGEECQTVLKFYSGSTNVDVGTYTLNKGKNTVTVSMSNISFSKLAETDRIVLSFENTADGVTPNHYQLYLDRTVGKK